MPKRIRTFIAVDIPQSIRRELIALQDQLRAAADDVKWVEPENLHITLKFLGEVSETELYAVCKLAARSVAELPAFSMTLQGVGAFPSPTKPRIIWAGVGDGSDQLASMHQSLEAAFTAEGYPREDRDFTAHLTLGRTRHPAPSPRLAAALAQFADWEVEAIEVGELLVMSSQLGPAGPQYAIMGRGPLAG